MKKTFAFFAVVLLFVLNGCQKDNTMGPDEFLVQVGTLENSTYASYLVKPDTVFFNTFHNTPREIDLDGDLECELCLVSAEYCTNSTTIVRELKIVSGTTRADNISIVSVNPNPPYMAKQFSPGSMIDINKEFSYYLSTELVLSRYSYDLQSGSEVFEGNWNGKSEKCLIVRYEKDGITYSAWVELSVLQYDNYVFHNFATFRKD